MSEEDLSIAESFFYLYNVEGAMELAVSDELVCSEQLIVN